MGSFNISDSGTIVQDYEQVQSWIGRQDSYVSRILYILSTHNAYSIRRLIIDIISQPIDGKILSPQDFQPAIFPTSPSSQTQPHAPPPTQTLSRTILFPLYTAPNNEPLPAPSPYQLSHCSRTPPQNHQSPPS